MEKIDDVEYNLLFPEKKEFVEWVKSHEKDPVTWIQTLDNQGKNIFDPYNTINS